LHNSTHADIGNPRLWECSVGEKIKRDGFMKAGTTELTIVREVVLPVLTTEQRVEYAIRCALAVYEDDRFVKWANAWLSGEDRTEESAEAAAESAKSEAADSAEAAWWAAAYSAAVAAAYSAAVVARCAAVAELAWAAVAELAWAAVAELAWAAEAARWAAEAAQCVAEAKDVDLLKIVLTVCPNYQIEYV
jgi:hypothetical protein